MTRSPNDYDHPVSSPAVAIVGGGVAGLSAAFECQKRGLPFILFESRPRLGGVVFSEQVDGFTIDGGPDSLLVQKPAAIALCKELGLGARLVPTKTPRIAYIQRNGVLHPLPAASVLGIPTEWGPFISSGLFSWPGKLRMGAEMFIPRKSDDEDESIGAFMRRRFGREATEFLAEPLLAGIHAGDVDRLSMRALFPRFTNAEREHGSLLRAFRRSTSPRQHGRRISLAARRTERIDRCARTRASGGEPEAGRQHHPDCCSDSAPTASGLSQHPAPSSASGRSRSQVLRGSFSNRRPATPGPPMR